MANDISNISQGIDVQEKESVSKIEALSDEIQPFGANLFQGNFANKDFVGFVDDYIIVPDDTININMWGAVNYSETLKVDPRGNIFIPEIGAVSVSGIKNKDLNKYLKSRVGKIYHSNVNFYATLDSTRKIKIFVTGFVNMPGLYEGMPSNSIIYYIDKAKGINLEQGSFTTIDVIRNDKIVKKINLYDFILEGKLGYLQLHQGDVIRVHPKKNIISVLGDVRNKNQFEIKNKISGKEVIELSNINSTVNYVTLTRSSDKKIKNYNLDIKEFSNFTILASDVIEFNSNKKISNIKISLDGEYEGPKTYILDYDATLKDLVDKIKLNNLAVEDSFVLYRKSVEKKQKIMLINTLDMLENQLLSQTSISEADAKIRAEEVAILEKFINKAKLKEPQGLVTLYDDDNHANLGEFYLEDQDRIYIPKKTNLVSTFGQVAMPSVVSYNKRKKIKYYVKASGGLLNNADEDHIYVRQQNGRIVKASLSFRVKAGDEIIVMPKIKFKTLQLSKDLIDVIFKTAITVGIFAAF
ncbi:MAG: protein involved in polysaccharide export with SLBB domain [Rickettsiales bacterium]|jgi:protein involved in polysaccharide export with SLBB domain